MSPEALRYRDRDLRQWVYAAPSAIHGRGLFARKPIAKGEYIGTYWGPQARRNGVYVLWVSEDEETWIGRSGRNLLRYLNHALDGNGEFDGFDFYAIRDVAADEELTFYYGDDFHEQL